MCRSKISMKCGNDLRAFANAGRDALDRSGAHVTDGEDARHARFQRMAVFSGAHTRHHEALRIELDAGIGQPIGFRVGADEEKEVADIAADFVA